MELPSDDQDVMIDHVVLVQQADVGPRDVGDEHPGLIGQEGIGRIRAVTVRTQEIALAARVHEPRGQ